jgi:hypothetical protein
VEDEAPVLVAWLKGDRSAEGHQRQGDPHETVVPSPKPPAPNRRRGNGVPRDSIDVARSNRLAAVCLRGSGRGDCR